MAKRLNIDFDTIVDLSYRVDFFDTMTQDQRILVLKNLKGDLWVYDSQETIIHEGADGHRLFIILSGIVSVKKGHNDRTALGALEGSDFFGEISFIMGSKRISSIYAQAETIVMVLSQQKFNELGMDIQIKIKDKVIRKLIARLDSMNDQFLRLCNVASIE